MVHYSDNANSQIELSAPNADQLQSKTHTTEWKHIAWHLLLVSISAFESSFVYGGLTILIPFYTKDMMNQNTNINETHIYMNSAMLFAAISFGNFLLHPASGIVVAQTSCELIIIISCVIHFIAQLLLCISLILVKHSYFETYTCYYIWCVMCFTIGISMSLTGVSTGAYITLHIPTHKRGRFMTYNVLTHKAACLFGSFSNGLLSISYSIEATLLLNSFITIVCGIIMFLLFIPPYYASSDIQIKTFRNKIGCKNRLKFANWIFNENKNNDNGQSIQDHNSVSLSKICQNNFCILFKVSIVCFGQFARKSRQFILTFQANNIHMKKYQITYVNTLSYIPDVALFILPGYLMDKYGRKYSVIPSLICLITASLFLSFANNYFQLLMIALLFGLGDGIANGSLSTIASDIAPLDYSGRAKFIGIFFTISSIPRFVSPIIIGALASNISLFYASMSSVFCATLALVWTIFILPETSKYHVTNAIDIETTNETLPLRENSTDLTDN